MSKKNVLYAVLNWGLGHATRSIPIIKALIEEKTSNGSNKYNITLVSTGRSLSLLKREFPTSDYIDLPDYDIKYSKKGSNLIFYLVYQIPSIIYNLFREKNKIEQIVKERNIDIIISENRYGAFSTIKRDVKNYFITHQLRFKLPKVLSFFEFLSEYFNRFFFRYYDKIFIMDNKDFPFFSGDLSHKGEIIKLDKLRYIGLFSDTKNKEIAEIEKDFNFISDRDINTDIDNLKKKLNDFLFINNSIKNKKSEHILDFLVLISGPEPQRTIFENQIMSQIENIQGKKIVILGLTDEKDFIKEERGEVIVFNYLPREIISNLINLTNLVICRSGYSTVMELVSLNKKALMIPTPGQTEQEYLSDFYLEQNLFYSVRQDHFNLFHDVNKALGFKQKSGNDNRHLSNLVEQVLSEL